MKKIQLVAHTTAVKALSFGSQFGRIYATGSEDSIVYIWALGKQLPLLTLLGHSSAISAVSLDYNDDICVAGSVNGTIKLWDLQYSKVIRTLNAHKGQTEQIKFHPFGDFFVSTSSETIKVWDIKQKGCIQTYNSHERVTSVRITPDGRWLAAGTQDGGINLWDLTAGKVLKSFRDQHSERVVGIEFSPTEVKLASVGDDGMVFLYDLETLSQIGEGGQISSCKDSVYKGTPKSLSFHPDGKVLAIALQDGLQAWNISLTTNGLVCEDVIPAAWGNILDMRIEKKNDESRFLAASTDLNFSSVWGMNMDSLRAMQNNDSMTFESFEEYNTKSSSSLLPKINSNQDLQTTTIIPPLVRKQSSQKIFSPSPPISFNEDLNSQSTFFEDGNFGKEKSTLILKSGKSSNDSLNIRQTTTPLPNISSTKSRSSSFQKKPQTRRRSEEEIHTETIPPQTEEEIISQIKNTHHPTLSVLQSRLFGLRLVSQAWKDGAQSGVSVKEAVRTVIEVNDSMISIDFLKILNVCPKLVGSLDVCEIILPVLQDILFEVNQEHIVTACTTIRMLGRNFYDMILTTLSANERYQSPHVDFAKEERNERCRVCKQRFLNLRITLGELKSSKGNVGLAVRDTIKELLVFG